MKSAYGNSFGYSKKGQKGIIAERRVKQEVLEKMKEARKGYNAQMKADQRKPKRGAFKI